MRRRRRRPAWLRGLAALLLAALLAWLGGFAWFLHAAQRPLLPPPAADGIVVLTGGADRVETALRLLAEGRAPRLLISGVGGPAEFGELARRAGVDPALAPRVSMGRRAISTRGNAIETRAWVRRHAIARLIVVTAGYHMPRALVELGRALPGVALIPAPVLPAALRGWREFTALRFLAVEYSKFLAAEIGLSGLGGLAPDLRPAAGPAGGREAHPQQ
ncbi:MAG: YdcF family protein [Rhodospirillales bacterium]|nr:YdcF family protein [Rhodospirillales bacterium]